MSSSSLTGADLTGLPPPPFEMFPGKNKPGQAEGVIGEALLLPLPQGPQVPQSHQWHPYEVQKTILQVWLTVDQDFFLYKRVRDHQDPLQPHLFGLTPQPPIYLLTLILSMECSFSALWLLWGPRNGQKPVFSLKTAISHSFPHQ